MAFNRMSERVDPIGCFGGVDSRQVVFGGGARFRWRYEEAQEVRVAAVCAFCVEAELAVEIRVMPRRSGLSQDVQGSVVVGFVMQRKTRPWSYLCVGHGMDTTEDKLDGYRVRHGRELDTDSI
ncbi:hypothetical protein OsI_23566 [Oryza sativa Indica Group]|uniref:Uncharacterized protein n=1 Tax=Oryza sativa subsp. indica TaxID=39946 RepID=A2YEM1_ORYSI|nr:hypothetical protein OsI_23566 [Oryza sativa Indica Group]